MFMANPSESSSIMSATAIAASETSSAAASESSHSTQFKAPPQLKIVGVILAVTSGLLIGSSFVFKKKGLLQSQEGKVAGEGVAYLKSWLWWTGMIMMILGEICNFAAYAFVDAVVVTPLGALSVVICAILSSIFLKETLTFFGWVGCFLCIVGSVIIALNGPKEETVADIPEFQGMFLSVGFLVFGSAIIIAALVIVFYFAPKYGRKQMLWYIAVCSLIGGLSVSCIQGVGAAFVQTAMGNNQFKHWFTYFLLVFVTVTLLVEIYYLNIALALFNTAMVTPTYYVLFTGCTLITSVVLYQGLKASVTEIITVVMGFFVICAGIIILQMSRVDPEELGKLDRRSTLLLKAAHSTTGDPEKSTLSAVEDPGMDALRGSFGAVGSIIRARSARRLSMNSNGSRSVRRPAGNQDNDLEQSVIGGRKPSNRLSTHGLDHLTRHQLYDSPMRSSSVRMDTDGLEPPAALVAQTTGTPEHRTIKFGQEATAHYYPTAGKSGEAIHEQQFVNYNPTNSPHTSYPSGAKPPLKKSNTASSSSSYFDPYSSVSIGGGTATTKKASLGTPEGPGSRFSADSVYNPNAEATPTADQPYPFKAFQLDGQEVILTSSPLPPPQNRLPEHRGIPAGHSASIDSLNSTDSFEASRETLLGSGKRYPGGRNDSEELIGLVHHRGKGLERKDSQASSHDGSEDLHAPASSQQANSPGGIRLVPKRTEGLDSPRSRNRF